MYYATVRKAYPDITEIDRSPMGTLQQVRGSIIAHRKNNPGNSYLYYVYDADTHKVVEIYGEGKLQPRIKHINGEIVRDFDGSYYAILHKQTPFFSLVDGHGYITDDIHGSPEYVPYKELSAWLCKEYGAKLPPVSMLQFDKYGRKQYAWVTVVIPD